MIKVSIIIPIFRVEKYIDKCLDSCVNQTLQEIEVIAINDASPDQSEAIMKKYAEKYPNKVVNFFLKENLKQGGARNIGIRRARGEYLCFVDGDDYIDYRMCDMLYEKGSRENLDIVCCNGFYIYGNKRAYWEKIKYFDTVSKVHLQNFTGQCYMIIRRNVIVNNCLYYPSHIFHEDCSVVPLWYLKANRIGLVEEALYYQNIHDQSSSSFIDFDSTLQIIQSMDYFLSNAKRIGIYHTYKDKIDCFVLVRVVMAAKRILKIKNSISVLQKKQLENELKKWHSYDFDNSIVGNFLSQEEYKQAVMFIENFPLYILQDFEIFYKNLLKCGYSNMREKILHITDKIKKRDMQIVVWGVGEKGLIFINSLKNYNIVYTVGDNNEKLWNQMIATGDFVKNMEWIVENIDNPVFLITATRFYHGIVAELKKKINNPITIDIFAYFTYENYYIDRALEGN